MVIHKAVAISLTVLGGLVVHLAVGLGCAPHPTVKQRARSLVRLLRDDAEPLRQQLSSRTVLIVHTQIMPPRKGSLGIRLGWGTGALISEDGYILTAAHCVPPDAVVAVSYRVDDKEHTALARTVWMGNPDGRLSDIAILKIEAEGLLPFEWASPRNVSAAAPVVVAGFSTRGSGGPAFSAGAGSIVSPTGERSDRLPTTLVRFTGPLGHGDSGGPLTTPDGQLIGVHRGALQVINSSATPAYLLQAQRIMCAVRPDPDWVNQLIATDRLVMTESAASEDGALSGDGARSGG